MLLRHLYKGLLLAHNGMEIENSHVEVSRTKKCTGGSRCTNIEKNCAFYHDRSVDSDSLRNKSSLPSNEQAVKLIPQCWFQKSCPYGKTCKFTHSTSEAPTYHSKDSNDNGTMDTQQVKNC